MERKICTHCNLEKSIEDSCNKSTECEICYCNRSLKRYCEIKDNITNQKKVFYEKNGEKLLQKQNIRNENYKELPRSYAELQNKLKAFEENFKTNDSKNN